VRGVFSPPTNAGTLGSNPAPFGTGITSGMNPATQQQPSVSGAGTNLPQSLIPHQLRMSLRQNQPSISSVGQPPERARRISTNTTIQRTDQSIPAGRTASVSSNRIPGLAELGAIVVVSEGRTTVLRGTVSTEANRQLAENLARLEPGVVAVRNELVLRYQYVAN